MAQRWVSKISVYDRSHGFPDMFLVYMFYSIAEPDENLRDAAALYKPDIPITSAKVAQEVAAEFVKEVGGRRANIYHCQMTHRHGSEYTKADDKVIEDRFYKKKVDEPDASSSPK